MVTTSVREMVFIVGGLLTSILLVTSTSATPQYPAHGNGRNSGLRHRMNPHFFSNEYDMFDFSEYHTDRDYEFSVEESPAVTTTTTVASFSDTMATETTGLPKKSCCSSKKTDDSSSADEQPKKSCCSSKKKEATEEKASGSCCGGSNRVPVERAVVDETYTVGNSSSATSKKLMTICSNDATKDIAACTFLYICTATENVPDESCNLDNILDFACQSDMKLIMKSIPDSMDTENGVCGNYSSTTNYFGFKESTLDTQKSLKASCDSMPMVECNQCSNLDSTTQVSNCDVHGLYMSLCQAMPDMDGCGDALFGQVCNNGPQSVSLLSRECAGTTPIKPEGWDASSAFASDGSIEKTEPKTRLSQPVMRMYYHTGLEDYVLWEGFVPRTPGQYFLALLFTFILGLLLGLLENIRRRRVKQQGQILDEYEAEQARQKALITAEAGSCCGGSRPTSINNVDKDDSLVSSLFGGKRARHALYWRFQVEKGTIRGFELLIAYWLMLIGMTFNVGLFAAVIFSMAIGVMLFDHQAAGEIESSGCC